MIDHNNSTNIVLAAEEVLTSPALLPLALMEAIIAVLAIPGNCLMLYVLYHTTIFPLNLRILLAHLSLNLIWYSIGFAWKSITLLVSLTDNGPVEKLVTNAFTCKLVEIVTNTVPLQNTVYTSLVLCLERLYSTVWYQKYERQHSKAYLALIYIPAIWCLSLGNQLNSLFSIDRKQEMPKCESLLSAGHRSILISLVMSAAGEAVCVALTLIVYRWNKSLLKNMVTHIDTQTLGGRFQVNQNVQLNTMLTPSMLLQSLCYLPTYLFLLFVVFGVYETEYHITLHVTLLHVNYLWKLLYALLHPIVGFTSKAKLYRQLEKHSSIFRALFDRIRRVKSKKKEHSDKQDDVFKHFEILTQIWASHAPHRISQPRGTCVV